jgi:hypothetical protein
MCNMAGGCLIRNRNCFSFANPWVHVLCVILVVFVFVIFLVYQVLSFSLDCPFLITPSVFSNVYVFCVAFVRLLPVSCVASVAVSLDYPFLIATSVSVSWYSILLCVCFVDRCLSFCTFSLSQCVVCSSSIYGLFIRYAQYRKIGKPNNF